MTATVTRLQAIKAFFGSVTKEEIKALSDAERQWLAEEAAKQLGVEIKDRKRAENGLETNDEIPT